MILSDRNTGVVIGTYEPAGGIVTGSFALD